MTVVYSGPDGRVVTLHTPRFFFYDRLHLYSDAALQEERVYMTTLAQRMAAIPGESRKHKNAVWIDPKIIKARYLDKLDAEIARRR